jgi:hypothetical protein
MLRNDVKRLSRSDRAETIIMCGVVMTARGLSQWNKNEPAMRSTKHGLPGQVLTYVTA